MFALLSCLVAAGLVDVNGQTDTCWLNLILNKCGAEETKCFGNFCDCTGRKNEGCLNPGVMFCDVSNVTCGTAQLCVPRLVSCLRDADLCNETGVKETCQNLVRNNTECSNDFCITQEEQITTAVLVLLVVVVPICCLCLLCCVACIIAVTCGCAEVAFSSKKGIRGAVVVTKGPGRAPASVPTPEPQPDEYSKLYPEVPK